MGIGLSREPVQPIEPLRKLRAILDARSPDRVRTRRFPGGERLLAAGDYFPCSPRATA